MNTFASAILAAVVLASAGAASAQDEYRIPYGDLDLSTAAHADAFDRRINRQARQACRGDAPLANMSCARRFREEAMRQLPAASRDEYARARRGERLMAEVPMFIG